MTRSAPAHHGPGRFRVRPELTSRVNARTVKGMTNTEAAAPTFRYDRTKCRYCARYGAACGRPHSAATRADWSRTKPTAHLSPVVIRMDPKPCAKCQTPGYHVMRHVEREWRPLCIECDPHH